MLRVDKLKISNHIIECKSVNLLIGSNSSGKTTLLREIAGGIESLTVRPQNKWIDELYLSSNETKNFLNSLFPKIDLGNVQVTADMMNAQFIALTGFNRFNRLFASGGSGYFNENLVNDYRTLSATNRETFKVERMNEGAETGKLRYSLFRFLSAVNLEQEYCESRLQVETQTNVQNVLVSSNSSILHHLYTHPDEMAVVQESIKNAFDIVIGFDDLIQGDKPLRILPKTKIAKDPNPMIYAERWKDSSQLYMDVGDGMKAYLKILLSILDPSKSIILIDEPEAFLHPPQRRNLGALIARLARDNAKQIFVATHDSEFMRGVISSTNDVKVLNLRNDLKSRQVVDVQLEDFVTLTNDTPSLLNERILNSFFYDKSVLTENESDRVFYEYAAAHYHYLDQQDVNFIGLFGIDSTIDVMKKMREIGINAVSIVDIDFLLDRQYPTFLKSEDTKNAHHNFKQYFNNQCYDRKQLKKSGLKYLKDIDHRAYHLLEEVIDKYAQVGIYIVPVGELESWAQTSKNNLTDLIQYITEKRRTKLYRFLKNVLRVS